MDESLGPESDPNDTHIQKRRNFDPTIINEGIVAGQRIAKISVITLIGIGIVELLVGHISGSVVATADGIDSMSDAMISFIGTSWSANCPAPARHKVSFWLSQG